ncbi:hypothetical protein AO398_26870 [Methylobacterium sp. GXS13]|uniref:hypothetical protein n=1 Tax=Methylobacterium sp. GXS13 TaxID=1730094 RepID=UPI00071BB261|nr:hypothetical protein [Methylobacterium sp. GXS13]KST56733.1 hypothetical protein AO398_26870 [Methylobacterium sp. GXS13]
MATPDAPNATTSEVNSAGSWIAAQQLAAKLIEDLDLISTIRSWNADEFALIATVEHVRCCVIYDDAQLKAFDAVEDEASTRGFGSDFRTCLAVLLDPILVSTTLAGVASRCRGWAVDLLEQGPAAAQAPAPFLSDGAMVEWVLRNVDPPVFAGPTGERILEPDAEQLLLTQAMRAELRLAVGTGWVID